MIQLVATDLDGTLLRPDGSVSARTRSALRDVAAHGVVVVLVTGRPLRLVKEVAIAAGVSGIGICANDALVMDVGTGEVIDERPLPPEVTAGLVTDLRAALPGVAFARETVTGLGCEPGYSYKGLTAEAAIDPRRRLGAHLAPLAQAAGAP